MRSLSLMGLTFVVQKHGLHSSAANIKRKSHWVVGLNRHMQTLYPKACCDSTISYTSDNNTGIFPWYLHAMSNASGLRQTKSSEFGLRLALLFR